MAEGLYVKIPEELKQKLRVIAMTRKPRTSMKALVIEAMEEYAESMLSQVPEISVGLAKLQR